MGEKREGGGLGEWVCFEGWWVYEKEGDKVSGCYEVC